MYQWARLVIFCSFTAVIVGGVSDAAGFDFKIKAPLILLTVAAVAVKAWPDRGEARMNEFLGSDDSEDE